MAPAFLLRILPAAWLAIAPLPVSANDAVAPGPAIWRIADEDTTIYLFGTIHVLEPTLKWRSKALQRVIAQSDELVVESSDADFAAMEGPMGDILVKEMSPDRPPLIDRVAQGSRANVRQVIADSGIPQSFIDMMPTWMAVFALGMGGLSSDSTEYDGADSTLERLFTEAGKPVTSVEDPMAVLQAIRHVPEAELLRLLEEDADAAERGVPPGGTGEDEAWARGDIEGLDDGLGEEDLGASLYGVLIRDRNMAWTDWLVDRMKRPGTVLFAVGAGHFAGSDSVQSMLEQRSVAVRRIDRLPAVQAK